MNPLTVEIADRIATVKEYRTLRSSVGWAVPDSMKCRAALNGSLFGVVALHDDATIGMARIVGDAEIYCTIVDVVVRQDLRGHGVGRQIMDRLVEWSSTHNILHVGLVADDHIADYYAKWGFQPSGRYLRLAAPTPAR
ncbi:GNAT family N-acetyltransferase [Nocardia sp. NPDC088792]|uniref:GNAT family N-acetyltransferase n=1 Tax=Nocardia sp. NPDC088792 TaxID=3364332 RepID=UPI00382F7702